MRIVDLSRERVTFVALSLEIDGGDGALVRAIAIEDVPEGLTP